VSAQLGLDLPVVLIGPGQPYEDPYGTWADLREIADDGVILARPDLYVAYRVISAPPSADQATAQLNRALRAVLGR
jgi:2,4-dichlorophenol 6-monooxygenase